jgi:hypothetical protein
MKIVFFGWGNTILVSRLWWWSSTIKCLRWWVWAVLGHIAWRQHIHMRVACNSIYQLMRINSLFPAPGMFVIENDCFPFPMSKHLLYLKRSHVVEPRKLLPMLLQLMVEFWHLRSFDLIFDYAVHFCQAIHTTNVISYFKNTFWYFYS